MHLGRNHKRPRPEKTAPWGAKRPAMHPEEPLGPHRSAHKACNGRNSPMDPVVRIACYLKRSARSIIPIAVSSPNTSMRISLDGSSRSTGDVERRGATASITCWLCRPVSR